MIMDVFFVCSVVNSKVDLICVLVIGILYWIGDKEWVFVIVIGKYWLFLFFCKLVFILCKGFIICFIGCLDNEVLLNRVVVKG